MSLRILLALTFLLPSLSLADREPAWPGFPPDCWSKERIVHSKGPVLKAPPQIEVQHAFSFNPRTIEKSPNSGYWFSSSRDGSKHEILVFAEKDRAIKLIFSNVHALQKTTWVNEKIISIRVWWGRIAGTDFLFDVEQEKFLFQQDFTDGSIAYEQFKAGCKLHAGCKCIEKSD